MGNEETPPWGTGPLLRRALGIALTALLGAGLLLSHPGESRSQGDRLDAPPVAPSAPLCGEWHRGSGACSPLDPGAQRTAYADLKKRISASQVPKDAAPVPVLDRPYDAGLPACRGRATRPVALPPGLASRLHGTTLYVVSASDLGRLALPPEVERDPGALILVVQARSLKELPELARRLDRPVSLGTADFVRALGVRCARSWLEIPDQGDTGDLHEAP